MFLVTGATGFVGSAVTRALARKGTTVGIARSPINIPGVDVLVHDLIDPLPALEHLREARVVHCAAEIRSTEWERHWRSNVLGMRNVLEWSVRHEARRMIFFSTGGVYGYQHGRRMRENDALLPFGFYGHTKHLAEQLCNSYASLFGVCMVIFRLYFPFGPDQKAGVFRLIEHAVRSGNRLQIKRNGAPQMTPVHIEDVVDAVELTLSTTLPDGTYNLCGDEVVSFLDLVRRYELRLGQAARLDYTDEESGDMLGDNTALRRAGWVPRRTIDDFLAHI